MRVFGIILLVIGLIILPFGIIPGALVAIVGLLMIMIGGGKKEATESATKDIPPGLADKIKEIDELLDQGTITKEEYEKRRAALLSSDT